jgi:hypothetical protein
MRRFRAGLVSVTLLATVVTGTACAKNDGDGKEAGGATKSLVAPDLIKMAKEVEKEVEALRGWAFKHPVKTDVRTEAQLREFIETKLLEEQYGGGRLERIEAFLRMVGLIPRDCGLKQTIIDVLLNQVGGFYDHDTKAFYMLKREGVGYGPLLNRSLVAHELTHALDDQYVDLGKLMHPELDEDQAIAIGSIVEGSATVLMMRYMMRAMMSGEYDAAELAEVQRQEMERSQVFLQAPPYFTTLLANYLCGMQFITRGRPVVPGMEPYEKGVGDNMLAVCKNPPVSSEQILHPQKYWDAAERDEPVVVADGDLERLIQRDGLHVVHKNTVGELLCSLLTSDENRELNIVTAGLPSYWTNEAATGWGGDRFFLLAEGKDAESAASELRGLKGIWVTLWDTSDDRNEFVEEYEIERELDRRSVFRLGDRGAVFLFGFDAAQREALQRRFAQAPPAFTKGGRSWNPSRE